MLKAKILREQTPQPASDAQAAQKLQQAQKPAPAQPVTAAPAQPDQKQVLAQAKSASVGVKPFYNCCHDSIFSKISESPLSITNPFHFSPVHLTLL